jgi:hypothetical protein
MRRPWLATVAAALLAVALALVVNLVSSTVQVSTRWQPWVLAVAGVLLVATVSVELIRRPRPDGVPQDLDGAADQLAAAVSAQWRDEEERRRVHDPFPLPVRWRTADRGFDHWANIRRAPAGEDPGPLELAGRLDHISEVYRRVPSGRLVVLGSAGSGKTILGVRFVVDLLSARGPADPVPVLFSLGSWNPFTTSLRDWLTEQLIRDHPGLAASGPGGASLARLLVDARRILPVLDGFDEIAVGLHGSALHALNATPTPLLLTSRPQEYAAAVAATDVLTAAAGVELAELTMADIEGYLPRATRPTMTGDGTHRTAWDPVLAHLRDHPHSPAARNLTAALSSPLLVSMARTVYSDTPGRDPAELLDLRRFRTPDAVAYHLLAAFVPAAYQRVPGGGGRRTWHPEHAQRWLGYLATHMNRLGTRDLAWWQLGGSLPRLARCVAGWLVFASVGSLVNGLVGMVMWAFAHAYGFPFESLELAVLGTAILGFLMIFGLPFGLLFGLSNGPQPARTELRIGQAGNLRKGLGSGLLGGLAFGLALACVFGGMSTLFDGPLMGLRVTLGIVLVVVLIGGLVGALVGALTVPIDIRTAVGPARLLVTDRTRAVLQSSALLLVSWPGLLLVLMSVGEAADERTMSGFSLALAAALALGLGLTAWGRWCVFARVVLPIGRRLPWLVVAFLDDAYQRGVLRRAGPVYQFRHARIQNHLAYAYQIRHSRPPAWRP